MVFLAIGFIVRRKYFVIVSLLLTRQCFPDENQ